MRRQRLRDMETKPRDHGISRNRRFPRSERNPRPLLALGAFTNSAKVVMNKEVTVPSPTTKMHVTRTAWPRPCASPSMQLVGPTRTHVRACHTRQQEVAQVTFSPTAPGLPIPPGGPWGPSAPGAPEGPRGPGGPGGPWGRREVEHRENVDVCRNEDQRHAGSRPYSPSGPRRPSRPSLLEVPADPEDRRSQAKRLAGQHPAGTGPLAPHGRAGASGGRVVAQVSESVRGT